jgi:hypothetical protein
MGIYVTYDSNPKNPNAEYQKRGKIWYKRNKGSKDAWVKVESTYNKYLDETFGVRLFNNVKPLYRFGIPVAVGLGAYLVYKRFAK